MSRFKQQGRNAAFAAATDWDCDQLNPHGAGAGWGWEHRRAAWTEGFRERAAELTVPIPKRDPDAEFLRNLVAVLDMDKAVLASALQRLNDIAARLER